MNDVMNDNNIVIRTYVCCPELYCVDSIAALRQSLEGILLPGRQMIQRKPKLGPQATRLLDNRAPFWAI